MNRPFVLFIKFYPWHGPMLERVIPLLPPTLDHYCVAVQTLQEGWRPEQVPTLVVVADAGAIRHLRPTFPSSLFMHVGHGLISKNETAYHYREADYICVASQATAARLEQRGHLPRKAYLPTGLMQMDPLFRPFEGLRTLKAEGASASVIYAPTWNPSLSSAQMFGDRLIESVRGDDDDIGIVIKPHPHSRVATPEWLESWAGMASKHRNVILADAEGDLVPALLGADLMVSDASSAIFQFLALDRPMVLVDNPQRHSTPRCFDPEGIEWTWRDIGTRVDDIRGVARAVREGLHSPDSPAQQAQRHARHRRRQELFGSVVDGGAAQRVAEAIQNIVSPGIHAKEHRA